MKFSEVKSKERINMNSYNEESEIDFSWYDKMADYT